MRTLLRVVSVVAMAALIGCVAPPPPRGEPLPAAVTVAVAVKKTVPIQVRAIGTVKVISTVNVRPRVSGELTEVLFKEGEYVKSGQPLFTIDPRPYDSAVKQAETNIGKSRAVLKGAELALGRVTKGGEGGVVSGTEVDTAETAVAAAKAGVAVDEAALHTAKLQASFTSITSPINGRAGAVLVTRGNIVTANELAPLVIINQIGPIDVAFSLPEQQLPAVAAAQKQRPLAAEADLRSGRAPVSGRLAFIDNSVDPTTGTVMFKAEFTNGDERLWPGQFVDVVLTLGERPSSVVVPSAAVQSGQKGQYVYVVNAEKKAELKPITIAFEAGNEAVIATGLVGGETVVTEGQLRLAPGVKVEVKTTVRTATEGAK